MPHDETRTIAIARSFQAIYAAGETLLADICAHFEMWPREENRPVAAHRADDSLRLRIEELRDRAFAWFNVVTVNVLPYTAESRDRARVLLRHVSAGIGCMMHYEQYVPNPLTSAAAIRVNPTPQFDVDHTTSLDTASRETMIAMREALRLVRTASDPSVAQHVQTADAAPVAQRNTAFILMWMSAERPELEDVHQTVKEVFAEFGIRAVRADDIEHQDRITDVILESIRQSEFLFADLSGERPNVYYEIGFAHAIGKRPILFRRAGTPLHFDISVHNVPEYRNITELKSALRSRLEAITGRQGRGLQE